MPLHPNHCRFLTAAVVAAAGSAWAFHLYRTPPQYSGPDVGQIRALADRLREPEPPSAPLLTGSRTAAVRPAPADAAAPVIRAAAGPAAPSGQADPKAAPAGEPTTPAPAEGERSPESLALIGVTTQEGKAEAWLVDLESRTRETAVEGQQVFGFTVREIEEEAVVLVRGGAEFALRLGERRVPVAEPEASPVQSPASDPRAEYRASRSESPDYRSRSTSSQPGSYGGTTRSYSSYRSPSYNYSTSSPGYSPGAAAAIPYMAWAASRGYGQTRIRQMPTSNPQTARRRGSRLVGDAQPIEGPDPISNPQTLRRLGTSSGPAFGASGGRSGSAAFPQNSRGR